MGGRRGEKVTLRIAAEYAKYTNFAGDPETFDAKSELLRQHCADAKTDFDAIMRSANDNTIIAATDATVSVKIDVIEARVIPHLGDAKAAEIVADYRSGNELGVGTVIPALA